LKVCGIPGEKLALGVIGDDTFGALELGPLGILGERHERLVGQSKLNLPDGGGTACVSPASVSESRGRGHGPYGDDIGETHRKVCGIGGIGRGRRLSTPTVVVSAVKISPGNCGPGPCGCVFYFNITYVAPVI